ncbi:MAG: PrsW family intramembrane metalloprotease [Sphingobacteriales bacterium]|nr:PrsW family intramembrane metalloprotease [Sphingobacteriales bacterium]
MLLLLLSLAIAPGIAISLFIYSFRKMGGTSVRQLIISFLLGMCATIPPFLIQLATGDVRDEPYRHSILSFAWFAFVIVALTEEGSKYLVVRWYAYPLDQFQEPFDGVIYSVITGMGFATVENIEYVWKFGVETGVARMFLSVPAHAAFAVLMGYNIGLAKFQPERKRWLMAKALLIVVLLHGSFDFFLFLKQSQTALEHVSDGMLSFCAFTSFYIAIRQAWKAIRLHTVREHDDDQEVN